MEQRRENELLTAKYESAFAEVRTVINNLDPIGLIASGAPTDEYEPEVTDLVRLVLRSDPFGENDVDAVWRRWFGEDYSAMATSELASQVDGLRRVQQRYGSSA